MLTQTEILKEIWLERKKYFDNYQYHCQQIKKEAERLLGKAEVLVFGSIIKGGWGPGSDIDVLIVSKTFSPRWEDRRQLRTKLKSALGSFSPFQLHLATPKEFKNWYKNFIKGEYQKIE